MSDLAEAGRAIAAVRSETPEQKAVRAWEQAREKVRMHKDRIRDYTFRLRSEESELEKASKLEEETWKAVVALREQ